MSTILIVEDHAMSRQVLKTLLGYFGHRLLEASDGSAALALASAEHPDLIITDILMPTMDGVEFVRLLRADEGLKKTPVIFYTATYRLPEARRLGEGVGVDRVISKPSDPSVILQAVNESLGIAPSGTLPIEAAERAADLSQDASPIGPDLRLAAFMDLSFHLLGQRDPVRLLQTVCRAAADVMRCERVLLAVQDNDGPARHFCDGPEAERLDPLLVTEIGEEVVARRSVLRRNDLGDGVGDRSPHQSLLVVPLATASRVYGWLCLENKIDETPFGDRDEEMAVALAAQAALAYENILLVGQLEQRVEERTAELQTGLREPERGGQGTGAAPGPAPPVPEDGGPRYALRRHRP